MGHMTKLQQKGLQRTFKAFKYSVQGVKFAWRNEAAFREEIALFVILVPLAFYVGDNHIEQALMLAACFLVVIVELINSSIEAVVDRVGTEHHPLAGGAKDLGSAAVMLSLILLIITWTLMIFN